MVLPVERTPKFVAAAQRAGLTPFSLGKLTELLSISPFEGEQLSCACPENPEDEFTGIYELRWPVLDPKYWIYYAHLASGSIWLIHVQTMIPMMDMLHGPDWLAAETAECRKLYLQFKPRR